MPVGPAVWSRSCGAVDERKKEKCATEAGSCPLSRCLATRWRCWRGVEKVLQRTTGCCVFLLPGFAGTMALYFFGQLASPNSFFMQMLLGASFIWFRSASKIFPNTLAKIQQKQQKGKAKRGAFNGLVV
jgi:hypothetical protein